MNKWVPLLALLALLGCDGSSEPPAQESSKGLSQGFVLACMPVPNRLGQPWPGSFNASIDIKQNTFSSDDPRIGVGEIAGVSGPVIVLVDNRIAQGRDNNPERLTVSFNRLSRVLTYDESYSGIVYVRKILTAQCKYAEAG